MMKWKPVKGGIALLMAALLAMPTMPSSAQEDSSTGLEEETAAAEAVYYNTGDGFFCIAESDVSGGDGSEYASADGYFAEDGSYTIKTELNAFFPYEVQFACGEEVTNEWFMDPDSTVEVGGHTFRVETETDGTAVTQMSLEVGGDTIVVYPEEKDFLGIATISLLPIKEVRLQPVDLSAYTPVELTQVSVKALLGDNVADGNAIVWKELYDSQDDYSVNQSGDKIDLSEDTYYGSSQSWEFIVGSGDQLDADNVRYRLNVTTKESRNWLVPTVYAQNERGERIELPSVNESTSASRSYYSDYDRESRRMYVSVATSEVGAVNEAYLALQINPDVFAGNYALRVYEGNHVTAEEAMAAKEITSQILCADMTQAGAGYLVQRNKDNWVTMVSFDDAGNVTGCLPFYLTLTTNGYSLSRDWLQMRGKSGSLSSEMVQTSVSRYEGQCNYVTYKLYKGYAVDGTYYQKFDFRIDGIERSDAVAAAYLGLYSSAEEAAAAGAIDIKEELFGEDGYAADYSNGVYMTIVYGSNTDQVVAQYCIKTEEGDQERPTSSVSSGAQVNFYQFKTKEGKYIPCYQASYTDDSYGEFNYLTVLVGPDVSDEELANLAPVFSISSNAKLYTAGSSSPEVSGESFHDFTRVVQYTVAAEDGQNAKNYWVQVVRASEGEGSLYLNSLSDPDAKTEVKDGIIYSTREIMLDSYHNNVHDILLANMGTQPLEKLSVELVSNTVELDEYWTLKGNEDLLGFVDLVGYQPNEDNGSKESANYGELWNLAKVRIRAKEGVEDGTDVSGTLTIKSAGKTLLVLTLTGTVGNPTIITKEIPEAVLYVPYGTMIQNSNKYSWNKVSYNLYGGSLPEGMIVKPNGEIYGVPRETGEFTFTVRMTNSYSSFGSSEMTYTLVVQDNTDANVDGATDQGYELSQRVQNIDLEQASLEAQTMVSQGVYGEFVDVYLDGVKLISGEDYTSESGSTRITIRTQTLAAQTGTHTLGIEFRTDADTLKRAAQNYVVGYALDDDADSDDSGDDDSDDNSGAASLNAASTTADAQYTVVKGDTLSAIAVRFGITLSQLLSWNPQIKNPNLIYPGQVIVVGRAVAGLVNGEAGGVFAVVQKGDCLYKIARRNGVSLKTVLNLNPEIAKQKYIYAGQKVRVK